MKHTSATTAAPRWTSRRTLMAALGVGLLAGLLYLPSIRGAFVWDDVILIGNPDIQTMDTTTVKRLFTTNFWDVSDASSGMYRPLTSLSYLADYRLHGEHAPGFHVTNIVLHAIASAVLLVVLLEMFSQPGLALFAAVWFAAFPMHVQSVAWVSGRTDVIATLFSLLSLWAYARWRNRARAGAAVAALFCFGLALLAKEVAVVLPVVVLVYELLPGGEKTRARHGAARWWVLSGMVVMLAAYFGLRHVLFGATLGDLPRATHGFAQAAALTFATVARYTWRLVLPFRLNPTADFEPPAHFFNVPTLAGIAVVALVVAAVVRWRHHRELVFGLAAVACGLAPVVHIVPINAILAEHWLYFPSFGFAVLVGVAFTRLLARQRTFALSVFALLAALCGARTVTGALDWKDDLTLSYRSVAAAPGNPRAHSDLGVSLAMRGRLQEAVPELQRAVEIDPAYAPAWAALGRAESDLGRPELGLEHCARAVEIDPEDARFVNDLGMVQFQARHYDDAARSFRRVLELRPRHDYARFNLGLALYQQRDFDGAVEAFTAVENKEAGYVNAWFFIAESEFQRGNRQAASQAASHFLSLHTTDDAMAARAREIAAEQ